MFDIYYATEEEDQTNEKLRICQVTTLGAVYNMHTFHDKGLHLVLETDDFTLSSAERLGRGQKGGDFLPTIFSLAYVISLYIG